MSKEDPGPFRRPPSGLIAESALKRSSTSRDLPTGDPARFQRRPEPQADQPLAAAGSASSSGSADGSKDKERDRDRDRDRKARASSPPSTLNTSLTALAAEAAAERRRNQVGPYFVILLLSPDS